eukprot:2288315-Pleurochrysis_carterae.AAC.1
MLLKAPALIRQITRGPFERLHRHPRLDASLGVDTLMPDPYLLIAPLLRSGACVRVITNASSDNLHKHDN